MLVGKEKRIVRNLCVRVGFAFKVVKRAPKFEKSFHKSRLEVCWHAKFSFWPICPIAGCVQRMVLQAVVLDLPGSKCVQLIRAFLERMCSLRN